MPIPSTPSGQPDKPEIRPGKSSVSGCLLAIVISIVVAGILVCVGGYWAVMHSSLPLKSIEAAINASGEAKITGLEGSLSSGMSADELRIFETGASDSWFTGIVFRFNGISDISSHKRVIVEELSVKQAYLSLPLETEDGRKKDTVVNIDFNDGEDDDLESEEFFEASGPEGAPTFELKKLRIDELVVENGLGETNRGSLLLTGFKAMGDEVSLQDIQITGDFLELSLDQLSSTNRFNQVIVGKVKTALHKAILNDIDFRVEFGGAGNGKAFRMAAFDGKVTLEPGDQPESGTISVREFTLSNHLDAAVADFPNNVTLTATTAGKNAGTEIVSGTFDLGETTFELAAQSIAPDAEEQELKATAKIGNAEVTAHIAEPDGDAHFRYRFVADPAMETDLVSLVLFRSGTNDLSESELATLAEFKRRHLPDVESDKEPESTEPAQ